MERVIIGTGRCGSTLLSTLMSQHPEVMVLSEFFRGLDPAQFWPADRDDVSPQEFIEILHREDGIGPVYMAHDRNIGEVLIDVDEEKKKHRGYMAKPTITLIALRFLSEDPDALLEEIVEQVRSYPAQSLHDHFQRLIGWLQDKYNKPYWIERSGLSTNIFQHLRRVFPNGKYVHIHRDGMETALSMRNHLNMAVNASYHALPPSEEELHQTLDLTIPSNENPMMRRIDDKLSHEKYADYWVHSLVMAYRDFRHLQPEQLLEIRFEDLIEKPREVLQQVADFFELPPSEQWLEQAVSGVKPPQLRAPDLDKDDYQRLQQACWLGEILTGRDEGDCPADIANGKLVKFRHALD